MAPARTAAGLSFALLALYAPLFAHASDISLTQYAVVPRTIYPLAENGSGFATTTAITLGFSERVRASISIEDQSGSVVRALYSSSGVTSPEPKLWDGKDDHGAAVAPGIYTILITAATSTGSFTGTSKTVVIASVPTPGEPAPPFPTEAYTFPVVTGWNLLSIPVVPSDTRIGSVFGSTTADAIWSYDPTSPSADSSGWLVYEPGHPELSNIAAVSPGEGYFVHAPSPSLLAVSGTLLAPGIAPPSRALSGGWNLVGSYASSSEDIDDAFATIGWAGLEYTSLWRFDAATQLFSLPSLVHPGDAFWILLDAPHTYAPADL